MFTGIVEELGRVLAFADRRLEVACRTVPTDSPIGASVAVNGVCLTVVERDDDRLAFDVTDETLDRTALGRLEPGAPVNLERAVTLASRLGGHLVQGHVDGVGRLVSIDRDDVGGARCRLEVPAEVRRYLVPKGSLTVDGVSLTIAALHDDGVSIALIPHTLAVTTFGSARPGGPVHLEADVIAKYVERLVAPHANRPDTTQPETTGPDRGEVP